MKIHGKEEARTRLRSRGGEAMADAADTTTGAALQLLVVGKYAHISCSYQNDGPLYIIRVLSFVNYSNMLFNVITVH